MGSFTEVIWSFPLAYWWIVSVMLWELQQFGQTQSLCLGIVPWSVKLSCNNKISFLGVMTSLVPFSEIRVDTVCFISVRDFCRLAWASVTCIMFFFFAFSTVPVPPGQQIGCFWFHQCSGVRCGWMFSFYFQHWLVRLFRLQHFQESQMPACLVSHFITWLYLLNPTSLLCLECCDCEGHSWGGNFSCLCIT